jgi:CRP-like cAMP-binding protein
MHIAHGLPEHIARLSELDVFAACRPRDLRRVDRLATMLTLRAGHTLCRRGEIGRECFVLVNGEVDVDVNGSHHAVGRGTSIGEMALLAPDGRRNATVVAATDLETLVFSRTEFASLVRAVPGVAHSILRESTRRLVANHSDIAPAPIDRA